MEVKTQTAKTTTSKVSVTTTPTAITTTKDEVTATNLSPKAQRDYGLVLKAIDGDQKAYTTLLNRYKISIFHQMMKMVNNRDDAEDLTLEAFGKAFKKLPSYAPRYAFSTWLFKIAINNCIDHIRKKRLHLLSIDDPIEKGGAHDFSSNLKANSLDPEEIFIRQQKVTLMKKVMGKLNVKYRLMIELRFFEELSYEEIATELEIPLGTVKAQLFRAKEILYNYLQKPGAQAYLDMRGRARAKKQKAAKAAKAANATA